MSLKTRRKGAKEGVDIDGAIVKEGAIGSLYQIVEGDPTNDQFLEAIRNESEAWRGRGGKTDAEAEAARLLGDDNSDSSDEDGHDEDSDEDY